MVAFQTSSLMPVETVTVETRHRRIRTPIPVPESIELLERLRRVEPRSMHGMPPVVWEKANGFLVHDPYGNQWIDLTSGILVANAGHSHPRIVQAIRDQLDACLTFTYAFPSRIRQRALERLVEIAPAGLDKAILFSSGTEATECCLSLMRKHGLSLAPGKVGILSIVDCFHGRTLSAKFASGPPVPVDGLERIAAHQYQLPLPGGAHSRGFAADLATAGVPAETVAGILIESIPGWTTTPYPQRYVDDMMAWSRANEALVAVDEVQCGMGRTGRMFAFEHYGMTPDLIACGKGLTSSVPASAVIGRKEILDLAPPGEMSSTFGGSPVAAAAVLANLDVIAEERLVERSARLGETLGKALETIAARHADRVARLNGRGLFYSLHLKDPETGAPEVELCDEIASACVRRGVMMFVTGRAMIKFAPPLTIDREALLEAMEVVGETIDHVFAARARHAAYHD
jgi:4-aminobutyrate aminotransferase-like enzyme